jgi:hypothetical protein
VCEDFFASSDSGASARELKHQLRNKEEFVLQTNAVLKMVGEAKENKNLRQIKGDLHGCGKRWRWEQ